MKKNNTSLKDLSEVAAKGSAYTLISLFILKFGGLIFTIIIARMLLPELFGVYALVLSIVTIMLTFTDLGLENTFLRYFSESLEKNKEKSRSIFKYLFRMKSILVLLVVLVLLVSSRYLSYDFYKQPLLFYPLIFSCLFIVAESFRNFLTIFFIAKKDLKSVVFFDASSQFLKIFLSIFAILTISGFFKISGIFLAFFISSFLTFLLEAFILLRKDKKAVLGKTKKIKKNPINKYLKYMALASLSLAFFGSIDTLMLGKFATSEYLGYYRVSLSIALSIASLFSLSSIFLPIFTQINNERFKRGFQKTIRYLLIISIPATLGIIFLAKYIVFFLYGPSYILATYPLYFLSILIISTPLIGLYSAVLESKERSRIVGIVIFISLFANIILNLLVINLFYGDPSRMISGVAFSTSLSRVLLLFILMHFSKKYLNLKMNIKNLKKPVIAAFFMVFFLFLFNNYVNINLFFGILEVLFATSIYFGVLILTGELGDLDWKLLKSLTRKH